jgi:VWFA-related protein
MTKKRVGLAAALFLLVIASASAQRFGESVQVTIVEVPVTVVDRGGNPVRGLTKDDFEVYDDGKRVPVEYFEVVDLQAYSSEASPSAAAPPPIATRNFLLLFDVANSQPGTIKRASEAAKEFVDQSLGDRDLAAVAVFTAESGAKMITSFTSNRTLLLNAIETLGNPKFFRVADPLMLSAIVQTMDAGDSSRADSRAGMDAAVAEAAADMKRMAQSAHDSEMRNRLRIQLTNFGSIARSLDRLKGQKQVILLSEGFDARIVQGREDLNSETAKQENEAAFSGEIWKVDNEQRFGSSSSSRDVQEMAQLFRRSDVVLHAIDIKGLRTNVDASAGTKRSSNEGLFLLASPTGGTVFKNANEISTNFTKLLKQQEVIYLLGFTARGTGKPGKFHELKVKTKAGRPAHRAGYYEPGARMTDLERTLTLSEILMTDAPVRDVDLSVAATALPGPGGKMRVPVVVEIPGNKLLEGVSGTNTSAVLYLYAFDEKNEVVDFMQDKISLDLTKAGDMVRGAGVRYFGTLRVPPGKYAVKALVRVEDTGRTGFMRSDITVPAFDTATVLPPVLFVEPAKWVTLVAPSRGDDYAYPFAAGEATYIPRRGGSLQKDGEHKIALFLYRVPLENLQVVPEVIVGGTPRQANVKLLGRTSPDDRGGIKLLFNFKPEGIPAGQHELRFTVKSKDGTESVVTMPFQVL